jgi:hypothetical protein
MNEKEKATVNQFFVRVFNQILSECSHCDNLIGTIESL